MLAKRILVVVILLPVGLLFAFAGGLPYTAFVALILALAAVEYVQLFRAGGFHPAGVFVVGGVALLALGRGLDGFASAGWLMSLLVLAAMTYHLISFECGRNLAGTDFGVTAGGLLYLGWIGPYLVSLRLLPDGLWWLLLVLPTVWAADSAAYFVGRHIGRRFIPRPLSPRLSPKKSWEGYFGGVAGGVLGGLLLGWLYPFLLAQPLSITPLRGAMIGLLMGVLTPLGDLGESMIKRQVGVKDSGKLLPGHGGMFDRIDSWLWAGVLSYYLITVFYL